VALGSPPRPVGAVALHVSRELTGSGEHIDRYTELLLRAQAGDAEAFAELYRHLRPVVEYFVISRDGALSAQERDDIVQEVFLRLWRGRANYRGDASARTFTLAIAKNVLRNRISRRQKSSIALTDHPDSLEGLYMAEAHATPHSAGADDTAEMIRQAMARLTAVERQAVELDVPGNLSRADAAKVANCTPSQFAARLYRARRRLRQMLGGLLQSVLV